MLTGSVGAWRRRCVADTPSLAFSEELPKASLAFLEDRVDLDKLAKEFAAGAMTQCPFRHGS